MTSDPHDLAGLGAALDEMARSTDRLLESVDRLRDDDVRSPSGLPGWTRAHVLTHVARNADGLANLAHWARTGEEREMYAGGREGRNAAIEEGAQRHLGDLRLDLADSAERLLGAFADFPADGLERELAGGGGTWFGWELPLIRIREVEVHHVDLASGYTPVDWSADFVTRTLGQLAPQFQERDDCPVTTLRSTEGDQWQVGSRGPVLVGEAASLLAWLLGRSDGSEVSAEPAGQVPVAPTWR